MLLKTLKVTNSKGSVLNLPLEDVSGGFIVKEINGLGPVKATLVSSSFANLDGGQYHTSRREPRNLMLKLGLDPDYGLYSVHSLRSTLYDFLTPKTHAKLTFEMFDKFSDNVLTQLLSLNISGRVESFEPDIFSREPAVDVSIMCFEPTFVDPRPVIFEGVSVSDLTETVLDYSGTEETGVVFKIVVEANLPDLTIYHRPPDETLRTTYFTAPLLAGDELTISSVKGSKYVTLKRDGVESSALYSISSQSSWIELFPGPNHLRVYSEGPVSPYQIEYTDKYGGL